MKNIDVYGDVLIEGDPTEYNPKSASVGKNSIRDAFQKAGYKSPESYYIDATNGRTAVVMSNIPDVSEKKELLKKLFDPSCKTIVRIGEQNLPPGSYFCTDCSNIFTLSPDDEKWFIDKGWPIPKRCESCRKTKRKVNTIIIKDSTLDQDTEKMREHTCTDCSVTFYISEQHEKWYAKKNISVPTRCPNCVSKKKAARAPKK